MAPIEKHTTSVETEKSEITSFHIGKDVISAGFLKLKMQQGITDSLLANTNSLGKVQANRISIDRTRGVLEHLTTLGIGERNLDDVKISSKGIMKLMYSQDGGNHEIIVDLLKKTDFILGDAEEFYAHQQKINKGIQDAYKSLDTITDAMHIVFMQNEDEWFDFDALDDEKDKLTQASLKEYLKDDSNEDRFEPYLNMNLKELSSEYKKYSAGFDALKVNFRGEHPAYDDMLRTEEKYVDMAMGIGDEYEGGAEYIEFSAAEFTKSLGNIVKGKSDEELIGYVRRTNKKIDQNNYQSTPVEESYKLFSNELNSLIFERFRKNEVSNELFLEFVKIISGHDETYRPEWMGGEAGADDNLKSDSENMAIMNDVILFLMTREGGIMDKVNQSESGLYKLEDEKIGDRDTGKIVQDFRTILEEKVPEVSDNGLGERGVEMFVKEIGYADVLDIEMGTSYKDLSFQQKAKISVLYRVQEKLENIDSLGNSVYDNGLAFTNYKYSGKYFGGSDSISKQDLQDVFTSVAVNANEELTENMTNIFQESDSIGELLWGKDAEGFGLTDPADIDIFNFFKEYQGIGALDFSERSIGNMKTTGKFIGAIAAAMAILPIAGAAATAAGATSVATSIATMSAVSQGMVMGATASVSAIAINPKGYDSVAEGVVDVSTDIVLGIITGAAGGWLVQKSGVHYIVNKETGARVQLTNEMREQIVANGFDLKGLPLSPSQLGEIGALKNKAIFAADLAFLGIIPEGGRMWGVDARFH